MTLLALVLYPSLMLWAGIGDVRTMTIPNRLVLLLLAAYVVLAPFSDLSARDLAWGAAAAAVVFVAAFAAFAAGCMGGGDVKLLAVGALWLGAGHVLHFVLFTAIFGATLTIAILVFRSFALPSRWQGRDWLLRLHDRGEGVPYGVAIAAAALFLFFETHWVVAWLPADGAA